MHAVSEDAKPKRLVLSVREAKEVLGCGTTKLYAMAKSKLLDMRHMGGKTVVTAASISALIDKLPVVEHGTYDRFTPKSAKPKAKPAAKKKSAKKKPKRLTPAQRQRDAEVVPRIPRRAIAR
jgi:hypothetical protein